MTARLKKYRGEWLCTDEQGPKPAPTGNGHTPERAYNWWLVRCSLWGDGQGGYWTARKQMNAG